MLILNIMIFFYIIFVIPNFMIGIILCVKQPVLKMFWV